METIMKEKVLTMLKMQDAMNSRVNPDWREAGYAWHRAIWTECAEMLDHCGWKWWKHQEPDMEQVRLEIVDIWHFTMSDMLLTDETDDDIAGRIVREIQQPEKSMDIREAIENLALRVLQTGAADTSIFANLMQAAELSFDELFRRYIGKNVLNFFRQDHGYGDGSYIKVWDDREDNEHLADILADINPDMGGYADEVYKRLQQAYPKN